MIKFGSWLIYIIVAILCVQSLVDLDLNVLPWPLTTLMVLLIY